MLADTMQMQCSRDNSSLKHRRVVVSLRTESSGKIAISFMGAPAAELRFFF